MRSLPPAYVAWKDNYSKYKCIYHAACMLHGKCICVGWLADVGDSLMEEPAVYRHVIVIAAVLLQPRRQTSPLLLSFNMCGMFERRIPHVSAPPALTQKWKKKTKKKPWWNLLALLVYLTTARYHHPPLPSAWPKTVMLLPLKPWQMTQILKGEAKGGASKNTLTVCQ